MTLPLLALLLALSALASDPPPSLEAYLAATEPWSEEFQRRASQIRMESIESFKADWFRKLPDEQEAEMRLRLADLYLKEGRYQQSPEMLEKASRLFATVLRQYPDYARADQALYGSGEASQALGRGEEALLSWNRLVKTYPASHLVPDAYVRMGEHYYGKNAYKALLAYQKATAWRDATLYDFASYKRAWCYRDVGEYDRATEAMRELALRPEEDFLVREARADLALWNPGEVLVVQQALDRVSQDPLAPDAPARHGQVVAELVSQGQFGRACTEVAHMEHLYSKGSPWWEANPDRAVRKRARRAVAEARRAIPKA